MHEGVSGVCRRRTWDVGRGRAGEGEGEGEAEGEEEGERKCEGRGRGGGVEPTRQASTGSHSPC